MYDVLQTIDGSDLSFAELVGATNNGDLVILSDWDRADLEELLVQSELRQQSDPRCTSHGVPC